MFEIRPETFRDVTKTIMENVPVGLPNGMQQKTAVGVGSIDGGTGAVHSHRFSKPL